MIDLKFDQPVTTEVKVDAETLAAIDTGIEAAENEQTVSIDDVRKMISEWTSKSELPSQR